MSDVFKLGFTPIDIVATDALPLRMRERFGAPPTLTIQRRGIQPPPEATDTWMGQFLSWTHDGVVYFAGYIRSRSLRRDDLCGWIIEYQAIGISDNLDKFPITDRTTGGDCSHFNCHPEDLVNYSAARAGRNVGQILTDVLTSTTNAANLDAYSLGNWVALTPPTLPAATVADLAALTIVPPTPVQVNGERFGDALSGLLQRCAPNVRMWVQTDGTLRFKDLRTFPASTLTMGDDLIEPACINRDIGDCWQRIVMRGAPIAVMFLLKLSEGGLVEDFSYGALSNSAAKAAWTPADFKGTSWTQDSGACTMGSTTSVTITTTKTYVANQLDQTSTGSHATVNLLHTATVGITSQWTARVIANAASSGGTCVLTIEAAPNTGFDKYTLSGLATGGNLVWRKYKVADSTLWPLIVNQSTYPQPFSNGGGGATMTSTPMGQVYWPQSGSSPPYNSFPLPFTYDGAGHIIFQAPTYVVANNQAPADVWAMLPVNTGPNQVASPVDVAGVAQYAGDSHTIEGLRDTLIVTLPDWRDPGQRAQVQAAADDFLDAVKNGVREGSVVHHGIYLPALTFGMSLNIAGLKDDGSADTTGWESAALPVVEVEVEFSQGADDYVTTIGVSSRRGHYSIEMFLAPEQRWMPIGLAEGGEGQPFGTFGPRGTGFAGMGLGTNFTGMPTAMGNEGLGNFINQAGEGFRAMRGMGQDVAGNAAQDIGANLTRGGAMNDLLTGQDIINPQALAGTNLPAPLAGMVQEAIAKKARRNGDGGGEE